MSRELTTLEFWKDSSNTMLRIFGSKKKNRELLLLITVLTKMLTEKLHLPSKILLTNLIIQEG